MHYGIQEEFMHKNFTDYYNLVKGYKAGLKKVDKYGKTDKHIHVEMNVNY